MGQLVEKILKLKKERNAVILAHNYQPPEVQDIADFVGDSLGLAVQASKTDAEVIVFCGVHFMAETAAIICPDKRVLIPDKNAGCDLANMITPRQLREKREKYPEATVVCYVNTTAEVKAESDICCTSSNAAKVVQSLPPERPVLFVPDKSLGAWVARQTRREVIPWEGYCPTHHRILAKDIMELKRKHPEAEVIVHPECLPEVLNLADAVFSTDGICRHVRESKKKEFIIGTEIGIIHRLKKENPGKIFYPASELGDCPSMKLNSLEKILWSLEDMVYEVKVPEGTAARARRTIERMLEI